MVLVALLTGLRRGECLGLRPEALFDEQGDCGIHVREQRSPWVKNDKTLKTKNAYRTLSLPREVFELLKQVAPKPDGYIFETYGYRVALRLEPLLKAAKVGHTTFHGLRDTFASFLFSQDIDLAYVSGHLGHASLSITQDYYISLMPEKKTRPKWACNGLAIKIVNSATICNSKSPVNVAVTTFVVLNITASGCSIQRPRLRRCLVPVRRELGGEPRSLPSCCHRRSRKQDGKPLLPVSH